jgi:hypothetical protein
VTLIVMGGEVVFLLRRKRSQCARRRTVQPIEESNKQ